VQSYYAGSSLAVAELNQHGTRVATAPAFPHAPESTLQAGLSGTLSLLSITNSIPCYQNYFADSIANELVENYSTFS
jgi:hypothetical protein